MARAKFHYLDGNTWVEELQYSNLVYVDALHHPQKVIIQIANSSGTEIDNDALNTREGAYTKYQKIRITDGDSEEVMFFGKVTRITPKNDPQRGQVVNIEAEDNLIELMKNTINTNSIYNEDTKRSSVISDIINGDGEILDDDNSVILHKRFIGAATPQSIDTSSMSGNSEVFAPKGRLNKNLSGSRKSALRVIEELADEDPQGTDINDDDTIKKSFDFYLDNNVDKDTSYDPDGDIPELKYFKRGTEPTDSRIRFQFKGTNEIDNNIRGIKPDYSFIRHNEEIINIVRLEYAEYAEPVNNTDDGGNDTSPNDDFDETDLVASTAYAIIVNLSDTFNKGEERSFYNSDASGGALKPGFNNKSDAEVTWGENGGRALLYRVIDEKTIIIGSFTYGNEQWREPISGEAISITPVGGSSFARMVGGKNDDPPGSLRETIEQNVEYIIEAYDTPDFQEVIDKAERVLLQSSDTVIRGTITTLGYPYRKVGSDITLLRSGMVVSLDNIPGGITISTAFTDAIVTKVEFIEGYGTQHTTIELMLSADGIGTGLPKSAITKIAEGANDGRFQTTASTGRRESYKTTLSPREQGSTWEFSGTMSKSSVSPTDTVVWSGGTLTLVGGRSFEIEGYQATVPEDDSATYWLYFDTTTTIDHDMMDSTDEVYTFQSTKDRTIAFKRNNIAIAWFKAGPDYVQFRMLGYPFHALVAEPFNESILDWSLCDGHDSDDIISSGLFSAANNIIDWRNFSIKLLSGTQFRVDVGSISFNNTDDDRRDSDDYTSKTSEEISNLADLPTEDNYGTYESWLFDDYAGIYDDIYKPDSLESNVNIIDRNRRYFIFFDQNKDPVVGTDRNDAATRFTLSYTTNVNLSIGAGRILLALVRWDNNILSISEYFDKESLVIDGGFIAANTITSNHIAANTITATEIQAGTISADRFAADLAFISELTVSPFYAGADTPDDAILNNYSRIVITGRADEDRPAGIFGYRDITGNNTGPAIEQFRFDSDEGQIIMSHGRTGGRTFLDGDGMTITEDDVDIEGNDVIALQIIGTRSSNVQHYDILGGDNTGDFSNSLGTIIVGNSISDALDNTSIIINKNRISLSRSQGIHFYANGDNTRKLIQGVGPNIEGRLASINTSTGSDGALNIESFSSDNAGNADSGIRLGQNGTITFIGNINFTHNIDSTEERTIDFTGSTVSGLSTTDSGFTYIEESSEFLNLVLDNNLDEVSKTAIIQKVEQGSVNEVSLGQSNNRFISLYVSNIDINGNIIGNLTPNVTSTETLGSDTLSWFQLFVDRISGGSEINSRFTVSIDSDLVPISVGGWNLGNTTDNWSNLYVTDINASGNLTDGTDTISISDLINISDSSGFTYIEESSEFLNLVLDNNLDEVSKTAIIQKVEQGSVNEVSLGQSNNRFISLYVSNIDINGNIIGNLTPNVTSTETLGSDTLSWFQLFVDRISGGSEINSRFTVSIDSDLVPISVGGWNLGNTTDNWSNLYVTDINASGNLTDGTDTISISDLINISDSSGFTYIEESSEFLNLVLDNNLDEVSKTAIIQKVEQGSVNEVSLGQSNNRFISLYVSNIDINGNIIGNLTPNVTSTETLGSDTLSWFQLFVDRISGGSEINSRFTVSIDSDLVPISVGGWNLGNTTDNWSNLYVTDINASGNLTDGTDTISISDLINISDSSGFTYIEESSEFLNLVLDNNLDEVSKTAIIQKVEQGSVNEVSLGQSNNRFISLYVSNIDINGNIIGNLTPNVTSTETLGSDTLSWFQLFVDRISGGSEINSRFTVSIDSDLVPISVGGWNLGNTTDNWSNLYVTDINASGNLTDGTDTISISDLINISDSSGFTYIEESSEFLNLVLDNNLDEVSKTAIIQKVEQGSVNEVSLGQSNNRFISLYVSNIDINGNIIGNLTPNVTSTETLGSDTLSWFQLFVDRISGGSEINSRFTVSIDSDLVPISVGGWNLGNTTDNWSNLYVTDINASGNLTDGTDTISISDLINISDSLEYFTESHLDADSLLNLPSSNTFRPLTASTSSHKSYLGSSSLQFSIGYFQDSIELDNHTITINSDNNFEIDGTEINVSGGLTYLIEEKQDILSGLNDTGNDRVVVFLSNNSDDTITELFLGDSGSIFDRVYSTNYYFDNSHYLSVNSSNNLQFNGGLNLSTGNINSLSNAVENIFAEEIRNSTVNGGNYYLRHQMVADEDAAGNDNNTLYWWPVV